MADRVAQISEVQQVLQDSQEVHEIKIEQFIDADWKQSEFKRYSWTKSTIALSTSTQA